MKNLKVLIFSLIFLVVNYFAALADITASAPSNMISSIASSSSFTSLDQNSAQAQNVTDNLLDSEQLQETVENGAETFGAQLNDAATEAAAEEEQFVALNSNKLPELEFPEPNLDTMVYDTGLMTLAVNTSTQYNEGAGDNTNIFSGEQKARVKVYIDFVRQKQWGSVESRITLTDSETITSIVEGGAKTITELPVKSQLSYLINGPTGERLSLEGAPDFDTADTEPWIQDEHEINSLLRDSSTPTSAKYDKINPGTTKSADFADMQKAISHTNGDKSVLVQAKFNTGAGGTLGTSTASFEVSNVDKCASAAGCTVGNEVDLRIKSIVRLEATTTTAGKKYTGE
jgi:hypothetical protein